MVKIEGRFKRGLTTTSGRPAPASAAASVVSKPPVVSSAFRDSSSVARRSTRFSRLLPSGATARASPDGRRRASMRSLDTSTPTQVVNSESLVSLNCQPARARQVEDASQPGPPQGDGARARAWRGLRPIVRMPKQSQGPRICTDGSWTNLAA
jgi:hypothetical protein